MNDKPAVIQGTYTDMKFMPGLKVARVSIEFPIERSNEFIQMFGTPDRSNPVWCVLARLQDGAYAPNENAGLAKPVDAADTKSAEGSSLDDGSNPSASTKREYTRSQVAALKCRDHEFRGWILERYQKEASDAFIVARDTDDYVDLVLKTVLNISSKKELDPEGPKAEAFKRLLTDYDLRNTVRR